MFLSVVVCTFNRSDRLRCCLQSLTEQTMDPSRFEVIVVDNNSSDDTSQVAEEFMVTYPHFRLISESRQGLSHARNRGYREAIGEYVAYIDDDAEASPEWVRGIVDFAGRHPTIMMFGGPYAALVIDSVPKWFPPEYGRINLGSEERPLNLKTEFVEGTNMIIRKNALELLGGFSPDLGMIGGKLHYGEETKLQLELHERGYEVYYVPEIQVRHFLAPDKMSLWWLLRAAYAAGRCSAMVFGSKRGLFGHIIGIIGGCVRALLALRKLGSIPLRLIMYYGLSPLATELGTLSNFFDRKMKREQST